MSIFLLKCLHIILSLIYIVFHFRSGQVGVQSDVVERRDRHCDDQPGDGHDITQLGGNQLVRRT